jgi:predicted transcriptional regulator
VRGKILRLLLKNKVLAESELSNYFPDTSVDVLKILKDLIKEGFLKKENNNYTLTK